MTKKTRNSLLLVLTALIWGVAFVAQRQGGEAVGPYSFNCIRSLLGAAVLVPVILLRKKQEQDKKTLWIGGICCGVVLFFASNLQQMGLALGTTAGKAGFLTACYIIFVPLLGIFLKKKCGWNVWIGVVLTLMGLYQLCISGTFSLEISDLLVLLCAVMFAVHILVIDRFSPLVDGVAMSCIQFLVCGLLSAVPMGVLEMKDLPLWASAFAAWDAWIPILYAAVLSCGVAYTLQIIGQKGVNPTVASLLMSMESAFSVLAGWLILGEQLTAQELSGCLLIFVAVVFAQLPPGKFTKKHNGHKEND